MILKKHLTSILTSLLISPGYLKGLSIFFPQKQFIFNDHIIDKVKLQQYLSFMRLLKGCIHRESTQLLLWIDYIQKKNEINGNIFEIGVYHGKSAILLGLITKNQSENLGLCDPFISKYKNEESREQIFLRNISSFFKNRDFIILHKKRSDELLRSECTKIRIFHIDGDHSPKQTFDDLMFASTSIVDNGVVIVDDFFNVLCPGVTEGVYKFISSQNDLIPLAFGFNKLFLCKKNVYDWYIKNLQESGWKKYLGSDTNLTITNLQQYELIVWSKNLLPIL